MQPVFAILIPAHVSTAAAAGVTQIENGDAGLSLMGQNQSSEKQKKKPQHSQHSQPIVPTVVFIVGASAGDRGRGRRVRADQI